MKRFSFWYGVMSLVVLVVCVVVRLYKINNSIGEWHSWRQADTASVARYFVRDGIDILHPRYDDLSNIQSGKDNPRGWRMVEMPIYQALTAVPARMVPSVPVGVWLRAASITASTLSCLFIMAILRKLSGDLTGLFAGLVFAVLPYSVFYGRAILPESLAVSFALASLWVLAKWRGYGAVLIASVFAALSLLVKPTAGFLLVPAAYLLYRQMGFAKTFFTTGIVYVVISILPFWSWRQWISQFPEGIPVYEWLLNAGDIRFKGAWFWWLFAERIGKLMLGYWGVFFVALGAALLTAKKEGPFLLWWVAGGLLYLSVFAAGNVQHDYYQVILLPVLAGLAGKGLGELFDGRRFPRLAAVLVGGVVFLFSIGFSWYTVRTFYWINRSDFVEAGRRADELLPKDAKVIASNNGDTTFLYYINRPGWPLGFDIEDKIQKGATHYVTISTGDNDGETKDIASRFRVLEMNERFAIIDLTKPKSDLMMDARN